MAEIDRAVIGVDVGTGSVRAGIFSLDGACLAVARHNIALFREPGGIVEQSSDDIWTAVAVSVRSAMQSAGIDAETVAGIGFDATCSLVALDPGGRPVTVSPTGDPARNIVVWMDHRAIDQADRINAIGHDVLRYVGGRISPEMETPKLLWLKETLPRSYAAAGHFMDLTDFLTWRATGDMARSICTVTCKWIYLAHEGRWDASYFEAIGLADLTENEFARIGTRVVAPGTALGRGLSEDAAAALGLVPGTAIAAGLIDAHAGGVGTVGAPIVDTSEDGSGGSALTRLGYVFGTSACTMTSAAEPAFVPGVWGPYYSAMVPGLWLNEGGQSAAGAAIDHLVKGHPAYRSAQAAATDADSAVPDWLADRADAACEARSDAVRLAGPLIVVPEFLGNRAPLADPQARAVISGLGFEDDLDSLVALYIGGVCGLGYGLRQIIAAQADEGLETDLIVISGGAGASGLVRQLLADAAGLPVAVPASAEPVLLGSAMLGAVAANCHRDLEAAMAAMSSFATIVPPAGGGIAAIHAQRYRAFLALQAAGRLFRPD